MKTARLPDEIQRKIILRAAELIEERGWTQGSLEGNDGRLCLLGALFRAARGTYELEEINALVFSCSSLLVDYLSTRAGPRVGSCVAWNDIPERTKEDVVSLFKIVGTAS